MKALKARWLLVADKLNALSVRERGIIFFGFISRDLHVVPSFSI